MNTIDTINRPSRRLPAIGQMVGGLARLAIRMAMKLERMMERRRSRRALLELSDAQLKDIGISRADAVREGLRPFWD